MGSHKHSGIQLKSRKINFFKKKTVVPEQRERTVRDNKQESCMQSMRESGYTRLRLERDVNREQHRRSNKSYGTTGGQQSQAEATAKSSGPSYTIEGRILFSSPALSEFFKTTNFELNLKTGRVSTYLDPPEDIGIKCQKESFNLEFLRDTLRGKQDTNTM